ncbi:MAG: glucokinase [Tepidisphaeraceae bacterium]
MILAGDIGGTNTRLALFDEKLKQRAEQVYRNEGRAGLTQLVQEFVGRFADKERIGRATFGVAGPVKEGRAAMTNLPWKLDEQELARDLKIPKVALINDLVAHAEGIELLTPEQLIVIHPGEISHGNRAVIAAGTGLGEAGSFWHPRERRHYPFASEGGHCDFSPRDERQIALMKWLRGKYPSASWERVLSGPGLRNIYDFLISSGQLGPAAALANANPDPEEISAAAMSNRNHACVEAMNLFVAFYGAEAAQLTLKIMATGGVYLGGGIAPKIADRLASPIFLEAFFATGPDNIRAVLRKVPIHIINFELNGLYGAALHASRL